MANRLLSLSRASQVTLKDQREIVRAALREFYAAPSSLNYARVSEELLSYQREFTKREQMEIEARAEATPLTKALANRGIKSSRCECTDSQCPAHPTDNHCLRQADVVLFRVDMEDRTGTLFCERCARDAWESSVYSDTPADREVQS